MNEEVFPPENNDNSEWESESAKSEYRAPMRDQVDPHQQLPGMYQSWFLDYASYVILERAVPHINDGLKPVQRRILHSMKRLDDGRYNKVANIVGHTMQFHPHGDASIGDALVQIGQKEMLIDCQGNWGNILTGDGAAAPRYIEARLSKFALDILFNPKTTQWKQSYDGRNKEPITLPVKFPLLLAQGAEGIAVGLSSKILPHNFNELIDASIAILKGDHFTLYPDFPTGGFVDISRYNDGERGGSVKSRAKIGKIDNKTLVVTELPFGKTTGGVIDSILKANEKGKIKIKKVDDNTAELVEILIYLAPGISSDKTIDALYAFTDCEVSISPNCCVIENNKPHFLTISHVLRSNTDNTLRLLRSELEIKREELLEELLFCSLEKIFIEERIYKAKEFENSSNMEQGLAFIDTKLVPFKPHFIREITREDLLKLMEIKMARIMKYNSYKSEEHILNLDLQVKEVAHNIVEIIDYTIDWYERLKEKYGSKFPRRTEIRNFDTIQASKVIEANEKLYINRDEGFIGTSLKKDEFVCNCSEIDDIILFYRDGKYKIIKIADKIFVGKNVLYINVFNRNDKRTIYNTIYRDGKEGFLYIKRFGITGATRDREYDLTQAKSGSRVMYFSANPNGEAEVVRISLKPVPRLKRLIIEKDFSQITIKTRHAVGNLLTKFDVLKISLKQKGGSTLGGRKVWFDRDVLRLNYDGRGSYLGEFQSNELIAIILKNGEYYCSNFDLSNHYDDNIDRIEKFNPNKPWTLCYRDGEQSHYYIKRFQLEAINKKVSLIGEHKESSPLLLTDTYYPNLEVQFGGNDHYRDPMQLDVDTFITIKGCRAKGKRIHTWTISQIVELEPLREPDTLPLDPQEDDSQGSELIDDTSIIEAESEITGQQLLFKKTLE